MDLRDLRAFSPPLPEYRARGARSIDLDPLRYYSTVLFDVGHFTTESGSNRIPRYKIDAVRNKTD